MGPLYANFNFAADGSVPVPFVRLRSFYFFNSRTRSNIVSCFIFDRIDGPIVYQRSERDPKKQSPYVYRNGAVVDRSGGRDGGNVLRRSRYEQFCSNRGRPRPNHQSALRLGFPGQTRRACVRFTQHRPAVFAFFEIPVAIVIPTERPADYIIFRPYSSPTEIRRGLFFVFFFINDSGVRANRVTLYIRNIIRGGRCRRREQWETCVH